MARSLRRSQKTTANPSSNAPAAGAEKIPDIPRIDWPNVSGPSGVSPTPSKTRSTSSLVIPRGPNNNPPDHPACRKETPGALTRRRLGAPLCPPLQGRPRIAQRRRSLARAVKPWGMVRQPSSVEPCGLPSLRRRYETETSRGHRRIA